MKVKFLSRWCKYRDAEVGDLMDMEETDAKNGIERGILEEAETFSYVVEPDNGDNWTEAAGADQNTAVNPEGDNSGAAKPAANKRRGGRKAKS